MFNPWSFYLSNMFVIYLGLLKLRLEAAASFPLICRHPDMVKTVQNTIPFNLPAYIGTLLLVLKDEALHLLKWQDTNHTQCCLTSLFASITFIFAFSNWSICR